MEYRELGRTGWKISAISIGTWAMGSLWGSVDFARINCRAKPGTRPRCKFYRHCRCLWK